MRWRTLALLVGSPLAVACASDETHTSSPAADASVADGSASSDARADATASDASPGPAVDASLDAPIAADGSSGHGDAGADASAPNDAAVLTSDGYAPVPEGTYLEPADDAGDSVLRHHKNLNRDGAYVEPALTRAAVTGNDAGAPGLHQDTAFQAALPDAFDEVYAQPLFVDGLGGQDLVIVATEADNVYALDAATGAQVWKTNVGAPVPIADMGCGNIDSYGITGTPVIDFASRTVFFDAMVLPPADAGAIALPDGGLSAPGPRHEIFALSVDTGQVRPGWPVDVGAIATANDGPMSETVTGQRGALAMLDGTLYVPFGGIFGDCIEHHGWVVAVPIADPTHVQTWSTTAPGGGAWAPGGIASDRTALFVSTGNTATTLPAYASAYGSMTWGGGEAVLRFGVGSAFGAPQDYFAPVDWFSLDQTGQDLIAGPVPFDLPGSTPSQLVVVFGLDGNAYLLDRTRLGGISHALSGDGGAPGAPNASLHVASASVITAPAVYTTRTATYVSFAAPPQPVSICAGTDLGTYAVVPGSPPTLSFAWCALAGSGSPIATTSDGTSDAIVWQLGAQGDNHLHAFDGDTGAAIPFPGNRVSIPKMRRYNAPIAAKGRIYVASDGAVVAFTP